ncbi:hypothetical protein D5071_11030 [Pectobacterium carotovorum]|uniref:Uncharacterized protein n=1 Tax=Pectobacterium carotovorum TaxID=554 RepID=A0A419AWB2_PECCA|nr:hypothetical protein D5071_11030 [Pectobacterium carotovorum]
MMCVLFFPRSRHAERRHGTGFLCADATGNCTRFNVKIFLFYTRYTSNCMCVGYVQSPESLT